METQEQVEILKKEGNVFYGAKEFDAAISRYTAVSLTFLNIATFEKTYIIPGARAG